ncbi:TolC family protein [Psychromonas sp. 14N.309.X.WAT.B.A12]|uniref:TolC family protein n=1 Tax=Psychromonas sp. 14N.309.X.WAT.B.A12 TaxID=2998322 RepID=UPI0025B164FE|nr:TolC family protein [Psychromonas sp. 14N.309.X.WAT.B.A12]MDN2664901.1 TolC family protein [Psychromonas sp. 14N.309.X.WAT.B.A12]
MPIKRYFMVMLLLCAKGSSVYALDEYNQSTNQFSLVQLVNIGLANNPKIKVEEAKIQSAITQIKVEEGGYWPSLDLSVGPEHGLYGELGYDVTLSQTLYDWGKVASNIDSATAKKVKQVHALLSARSEVALEVIEVCYEIYTAREKLNVLQQYQSELHSIYLLAKERDNYQFSDSSELSKVFKYQAYVDEQFATIQGELKAAERLYILLLRQPPSTLPQFTESFDIFEQLNTQDKLEENIVQSPDYMQAQQDIYIAEFDAKSASAGLKPNVVLEASTIKRDVNGVLTKDSSIGINVKMQINQGLSAYYQAQSELQLVEAAKWELQSVHRDLAREFGSDSESRIALRQRVEALKYQVKESSHLVKVYLDQFSAGLRTIEDLLTNEAETFQLKTQLISASSEYQMLPYRTASKLGMLNKLLLLQGERERY